MTSVRISFLIPVYSEVEILRQTVEVLESVCGEFFHEIILLVHRDSIQACKELCRELSAKDPRVHVHEQIEYPGQGHAFREGFALATGTHILMMNADMETNPADARKLIQAVQNDASDLVVASRWAKGGSVDVRGYGLLNYGLATLFQKIFMALLGTSISDLTFCYKIGSARLFKSIPWEGTGHELAMETTMKPILMGYRVSQIPTAWVVRREGRSNHKFRRNLRHLALAIKLCANRRRYKGHHDF